MKTLFMGSDDLVYEVIVHSSTEMSQIRTPKPDADALVESGDAIIYNSRAELDNAILYAKNRRNNYPAIEEQLDQIYHEGIDAWKETIQAVKDAHPKPE